MASTGPLYLGLDLSTQQLKAIVINADLTVVAQAKVDFDADFGAQYGITKGVLVSAAEGEVFAPVRMWLEAMDLVFARLKAGAGEGLLQRVRAISGSCQQHGSVYWGTEAERLLGRLREETGPAQANSPLTDMLADAFSRPYAPNWQDQSTQAECDEFDACLGGREQLAAVTGSAAHHRFTGPQIMRIRRRWPADYAATARISLVSSFVASVLLGRLAPIDISDVCGMDLWDIQNKAWSEPLLALAGGGDADALRTKLGDVRLDGGGSLGPVAAYFVRRYGFSADAAVCPFTGDNPATILALPLRPHDAIVSLGTSTTFLMVTPHYRPDPAYHFFHHPTSPGQYMFMLCYKNGGLARERVRDTLTAEAGDADPWAAFNRAVLTSPRLGASGPPPATAKLGLYFYLNEIVPNIPAGTWRYTASLDTASPPVPATAPWTPAEDARAIVESQALSMRLRAQPMVQPATGEAPLSAVPPQPRRLYLVGGGSLNPAIAQVLGEVLGGVEGVYRLDVGGNACALGGAYKALWAVERASPDESFDELLLRGGRWREEGNVEKVDVGYRPVAFAEYGRALRPFAQMEEAILAEVRAP